MIATHGDMPIERMRLDRNFKWLGSVSHDDTLKLTDVSDLFEDSDEEGGDDDDDVKDEEDDAASQTTEKPGGSDDDSDAEMTGADEGPEVDQDGDTAMEEEDSDDSDPEEDRKAAKRAAQRQKKKDKQRESKVGLFVPKEDKKEKQSGFFDDL